jgi:hypothetical protein
MPALGSLRASVETSGHGLLGALEGMDRADFARLHRRTHSPIRLLGVECTLAGAARPVAGLGGGDIIDTKAAPGTCPP